MSLLPLLTIMSSRLRNLVLLFTFALLVSLGAYASSGGEKTADHITAHVEDVFSVFVSDNTDCSHALGRSCGTGVLFDT